MLRPSGSAAITSTSAPRRRNTAGAASKVAPLAQSSRIRRPLQVEALEALVQRRLVAVERAVEAA